MKQIVTLQDIPETLDMQELMEVKGGTSGKKIICIFRSVVTIKCAPGVSAVVQEPEDPIDDLRD